MVDREATAAWYVRFAGNEARGQSPLYEEWALGVADDAELVTRLLELPRPKRQPNLIFSVSRLLGAPESGYGAWRAWLITHWTALKQEATRRSTQTNEPRRCAALIPLLGRIDGPIALLEVGASAGLCLYPDRYSYAYHPRGTAAGGNTGTDTRSIHPGTRLDPVAGPSTVLLECATTGSPPIPSALPTVVWRAGIDLAPLDVADADDMRWLETLVWPEQHERRTRIRSAIEIVRADPPTMVRADATDALAALAASAPAAATLVVVTMGVLVYLGADERTRFTTAVGALDATWISLEGAAVLPATKLVAPSVAAFALALDGRPVAWCGPHGQSIDWIAG